jgi:hypothetical protein
VVPSWSGGILIGTLIKGHHAAFLAALETAWQEDYPPPAAVETVLTLTLRLSAAGPVKVVSVEAYVEAHTDAPKSDKEAMLIQSKPQAHLRTGAAHDQGFALKVGVPRKVALAFGVVDQRKAGTRDGTRSIKVTDPPARGGPLLTPTESTKGRKRKTRGVRSAPSG